MKKLFTDRFGQSLPRTKEGLDAESRDAIWGLISARITEEWFGYAFNDQCGDGYAYAGTATGRLQRDMAAYKILWPPEQIGANPAATDGQVFDAVEYSYQHIAEPSDPSYHSYMCNGPQNLDTKKAFS